MPKTTTEILEREYELNDEMGILSEEYKKFIKSVWYSEEEVDNIIKQCLNINLETLFFKASGIPRCPKCHKDFIKEGEYEWKPDCHCFRESIKISIG